MKKNKRYIRFLDVVKVIKLYEDSCSTRDSRYTEVTPAYVYVCFIIIIIIIFMRKIDR